MTAVQSLHEDRRPHVHAGPATHPPSDDGCFTCGSPTEGDRWPDRAFCPACVADLSLDDGWDAWVDLGVGA